MQVLVVLDPGTERAPFTAADLVVNSLADVSPATLGF
jgi:hypothetical protein